MKNIAIIGASGFIGAGLLKEALSRNHRVTAIVRHTNKITLKHPLLTVRKGNALDVNELSKLLIGFDAVISAYNPGWTNPDIYDETIAGYSAILAATKSAGIKRILIVGGAGSLLVHGTPLYQTGALPDSILPAVISLAEVLKSLQDKEKDLDWVFFSPAGNVVPGERTGIYKLGKDKLVTDENDKSRISIGDYAMAMINELEDPQHHFERFTIGY